MDLIPGKPRLVGYKPLTESFNYYALDDGTVLGVKAVVVKVLVPEGTDGRALRGPDGNKVYTYSMQTVTQVLTREEYNSLVHGNVTTR